jgi:integrase
VAVEQVLEFNSDPVTVFPGSSDQVESSIQWELLIRMALCTAMRRGELLNTTWKDIDFERKTVEVCPKVDGQHTWLWYIKDIERRILPLTDDVLGLLADLQGNQAEGYPYVFVPGHRYERIQKLRKIGK